MLCYLDNAATSFPKPRAVYDEVYKCMSRYCGNPGRGSHALSLAAAKKIFECRELVADLVGISDPARIIFTYNTTYAINMVIKGVLKKGDHVIISDMEHNAVLRPIFKLAKSGLISYDVFPSLGSEKKSSPTLICAKIATLLKPNTKMIICAHASNICSITLPIKEIGEFCKKRSIFFLVDGAQGGGHIHLNMKEQPISMLALAGHKGLYGIMTSGVLLIEEGLI
ncbi:MAG: aminotransferase class V-fold PLP-dependent enzyme, partial [Clostridia bacterium]|nr:aminotransferase class V-fold PLP-dependent enzyme [Clostridia bacterium]